METALTPLATIWSRKSANLWRYLPGVSVLLDLVEEKDGKYIMGLGFLPSVDMNRKEKAFCFWRQRKCRLIDLP